MDAKTINAMTVDVEDYFHVAALSGAIDRARWDDMQLRVHASTEKLLEVFDEVGLRATFFVLGWVAERRPQLVRMIHKAGHEIASHGYSHSLVYEQTPHAFREETTRSKAVLEAITGSPVEGYRAASYSITPKSRWALDILAESGFVYDSSVFPVRHDLYGMPGAPRFPHVLTTDEGRQLVEFPPGTVRLFGQNLPAPGGGYFRLYPYSLTRWLLRRVVQGERMPAIFYLHPWEVDPDQPRVNVGFRSRFRHYNNLEKCEVRLRRLVRDFRFGAVRDVLESISLLPPSSVSGQTSASRSLSSMT
jgi:polysaccharide deacetylase family protein (PEP-CTERM system associated)